MANFFKKTKKVFLYSLLPILISLIFVAAIIYAWTEPGSIPPTGNVSAPINVSANPQSKAAGLILNTGGAANGLIVQYGNVGIGTTSPEGLQVNIAASETARGADNVRFGVLSGTPRVILEDSGFTQWLIDNSGGGLRFFNPGVVRMSLSTAGRLDVTGDMSWGGTLQGGTVPWARLGSFPAGCGANTAVQVIGTTLTCIAVGGAGGTPGGANTHVQYNNSGAFGGDAGFTYGAGGNDLSLGGSQAGNFNIKNSIGTTTISLNSDANSWFNVGNVGIGTTSPSGRLHIGGNDQRMYLGTSGWFVFNRGAGATDIYFGEDSDTGRYLFRGSGNVGIGTASPGYKLDVVGDINLGGTNVYRRGGTAGVSVTCGAGNTPSGITTSGGIVTSAGACTAIGAGGLSGSGTTNQVAKWTAGTILGNSTIFDDGSNLRYGTVNFIGFHYAAGGGDLYLGGAGDQAGNLFIKDSGGTTRTSLNSDGTSVFTYDVTVGGSSVCRADGTNCPARTTATCSVSGGTSTSCQASCPVGYTVTGGGMDNAISGGSINGFDSFPETATSWRCGISLTFGGTNTMTCYAVCRRGN